MSEFKKRRTKSAEVARVALGLLGVLALAAVAFVAGRAAWGMYGKFGEAAAARASAAAQLSDLKDRHAKIEEDVRAFSTERGLEGAVRERYGVVRPGEGQIDIVRQASTTGTLRASPSVWEQLWRLLFVW